MIDRNSILQIFGSLMKHPQYLSETDKYTLTPDDFYYRFDKYIFIAISNLYTNGAQRIQPIDVENYLSTNEPARIIFKQQNGIEFLQDADELSEELNFQFYYKRLKKFNLLESFKSKGFDTSDIYVDDPLNDKDLKVNESFESLEIDDILAKIKQKLLKIERNFIQNDTTETTDVFQGIEEIIESANDRLDVGIPLQGEIFNEICAGARKGTFYLRSGSSGVGKSRQAVGDACYIAFPFYYVEEQKKWIFRGSNKKVLFIATEQDHKEIQKMILAYLTGFNETKFRYGGFTSEEERILRQAVELIKIFKENFYIVRMPNPTIELLKTIVRENVLMHDVEYVFFDYIHIAPSLLGEFKGFSLRNDELLLMMSTALKDLAVELQIFVMSSTQVNANADSTQNIRNESTLAGSRSIINKADLGVVCARPTKEEIDLLTSSKISLSIMPNMVTDVYKVRSGEWTQVRIWSDVNLGNLRKKDLFVTNSRMEVVDVGFSTAFEAAWDTEEYEQLSKILDDINGME